MSDECFEEKQSFNNFYLLYKSKEAYDDSSNCSFRMRFNPLKCILVLSGLLNIIDLIFN